jgi:uracil-DNA glycosylase family 4
MAAVKLPQPFKATKFLRNFRNCTDCQLWNKQYNLLSGRGMIPCDLLIISDYPSRNDELSGKVLSGHEGRLFDYMMDKSGLNKFTNYITYTLLCCPIDKKNGNIREPTISEIAMCRKNIFTIIRESQAKFYLLLGDLPKKYLGTSLPGYYNIPHPLNISLTGATKSPLYLQNLRKLEEIYATIETNTTGKSQ